MKDEMSMALGVHSFTLGDEHPCGPQGQRRVVLASASPRRQQLLGAMGVVFQVLVTDVDESIRPGEGPEALVARLSRTKAHAALSRLAQEAAASGAGGGAEAYIIAADTIVVAPDERTILGKPSDLAQAREMLAWLRNKRHRVCSGLALLEGNSQRECVVVARTDVHMRNYDDEELERYVRSGDPLDKAGAYAIQHDGFAPIDHLDNCYANVMGLPMCHLYGALETWRRRAPEEPVAQAGVRATHPLACCPYALEHGGCAWADEILAQPLCLDAP